MNCLLIVLNVHWREVFITVLGYFNRVASLMLVVVFLMVLVSILSDNCCIVLVRGSVRTFTLMVIFQTVNYSLLIYLRVPNVVRSHGVVLAHEDYGSKKSGFEHWLLLRTLISILKFRYSENVSIGNINVETLPVIVPKLNVFRN